MKPEELTLGQRVWVEGSAELVEEVTVVGVTSDGFIRVRRPGCVEPVRHVPQSAVYATRADAQMAVLEDRLARLSVVMPEIQKWIHECQVLLDITLPRTRVTPLPRTAPLEARILLLERFMVQQSEMYSSEMARLTFELARIEKKNA
jgi:hypothetical protein